MSTQTMRRLREISLFECDARVLRNGFCELTIRQSIKYPLDLDF